MPDKQTLEDLLLDDSFIRYIKGSAPADEQKYWTSWLYRHPGREVLVEQAKELIRFTGSEVRNVPEPRLELEKLEESVSRLRFQPKKPGGMKAIRMRRRSASFWWSAVAAVVLLILSVGLFLNMEGGEELRSQEEMATHSRSDFRTTHGEKTSLYLSDGSRIVLNANSKLTYSYSHSNSGSAEGGRNRNIEVWLEGEAWFDISSLDEETSRLFTVHTPDGRIEVLGTTFAVRTSSEGTRAVLEKGELRVSLQDAVPSGYSGHRSDVIMKPGELAQLLPGSGLIEVKKVNPEVYTSWIRDVWTFEQTPVAEIAERIETVFGVNVEIMAGLREKTLSGTIRSTNLQIIKEGLSEALQEEVILDGERIIIGINNPR